MSISMYLLNTGFMLSQAQNIGINTATPHPSSIIEISADAPPGSPSASKKKGVLFPRVALTSDIDQTTIPSPAKGLTVYNTATAGSYPNTVSANDFYFWDGAKWQRLTYRRIVEDAVKPRVFYIESNAKQEVPGSAINYSSGVAPEVVTTFSGVTPSINSQNMITQNSDNSFTVNKTGLYNFSAFINMNPMNRNNNSRAFLNLKIQISTNNGASWTTTSALSRSAWGFNSTAYLKTVNIEAFPLQLQTGTRFRLTFSNPFTGNTFGAGSPAADAYIGTNTHLPISKGIRVQMLDFNL